MLALATWPAQLFNKFILVKSSVSVAGLKDTYISGIEVWREQTEAKSHDGVREVGELYAWE